ncbi:MAG: class I and II aminotransferase, partial [Spirochaetes bacterium]
MKKGKVEETIANTCANYRAKRNYMIEMMDRYMPKRSDLKWTKPEGGLFLWITLPAGIDSEKLLFKAVERKVAYVVGSAFYFDEPAHNAMRINFSYATMDQIEEGIRRLSEVISESLA